ncbi:putative NADH:ubiquinone oxidoreductase, subunit RnfG [Serratia symbiotica str. 'Cinara cedri']|nr:putative NADH:ubiquinone oxidoreductase, subunit RnfG [Serratia symbiotica str. 'Cinara cedri']
MLKSIKKHGITLAIFAAITTGLTATINSMTQKTIKHQTIQQQKRLLDQVVPPKYYDNNIQSECFLVSDSLLGNNNPHHLYLARKNNKPSAAALDTIAPDGYSGEIQILVGADFHGTVLGARVIKHHETPGLGDKIELSISNWITCFSGQTIENSYDQNWAVKKDGGIFDQFTGATITPRAVVNAVHRTALYIKTLPSKLDSLSVCNNNK